MKAEKQTNRSFTSCSNHFQEITFQKKKMMTHHRRSFKICLKNYCIFQENFPILPTTFHSAKIEELSHSIKEHCYLILYLHLPIKQKDYSKSVFRNWDKAPGHNLKLQ